MNPVAPQNIEDDKSTLILLFTITGWITEKWSDSIDIQLDMDFENTLEEGVHSVLQRRPGYDVSRVVTAVEREDIEIFIDPTDQITFDALKDMKKWDSVKQKCPLKIDVEGKTGIVRIRRVQALNEEWIHRFPQARRDLENNQPAGSGSWVRGAVGAVRGWFSSNERD